jgi:glycerol-3-phosphate dehydrogenase
MAQHAVDKALSVAGISADPCRTKQLPLLGAASRDELAQIDAPERLVRRFGTEATLVVDNALTHGLTREQALAPVSATIPVTLAELVFGVTHEGASDLDDLLDRRTRVGLVPADRAVAEPLARKALAIAKAPTIS